MSLWSNPAPIKAALAETTAEQARQINALLDQVIRLIQKSQREAGKTFVSRTSLQMPRYQHATLTVFRVVLANPLTTDEILDAVLQEQCDIARQPEIQQLLGELRRLLAGFAKQRAAS